MFYVSQTLYCPVCKEKLGTRNKSMPFEGLCEECQVFYFFPPNVATPTKNITVKKRDKQCGCPTCKARDGLL